MELHRNFSQMFSNAYDDLGPYPLDEDPQASDFAAYCVDMTASELAVGNFVILSDGSWYDFSLMGVYIVHDINRGMVLLDRVLITRETVATELFVAQQAALTAARTAGNLDEVGNPIMPPNVVAGDTLVAKKVKISNLVGVYALTTPGLNYVRLYDGYHNGTEVEPIPAVWGKAPSDVEVVLPLAPPTVIQVKTHEPYTIQQNKVGTVAFTNLIGRDMNFYGKIMQSVSKVDEKSACRLRSESTVTDRMLKKNYVNKTELLVALMTGNYTIHQDPKCNSICLLDFQSCIWTTTANMWSDVFEAAVVMDILFRLESPSVFTELFIDARNVLRRTTQELNEVSEFDFTKSTLLTLWQSFGLVVTRADLLSRPLDDINEVLNTTFNFVNVDLAGKLTAFRNRQFDKFSRDFDNVNINKRVREEKFVAKDRNPVPVKKDKKEKGYCTFYYCFLANATDPVTGTKYINCKNERGLPCNRFSHVAVTSDNVKAIKEAVLHRVKYTSVKVVVENYLNTF